MFRKAAILFQFLILLATPCSAQKHNLIASDAPFGAGSTIKLEGGLKIERGLLNGVRYEIYYSDGSGRFAGSPERTFDPQETSSLLDWMVGCSKDSITDTKSCWMNHGDFSITVFGDGKTFVHIGDHHYPSSEITIRVDQDAPISANSKAFSGAFSPIISDKIVGRIAKAKTVTTRFNRWPEGSPTETWNVFGFNEALAYLKWAFARIK